MAKLIKCKACNQEVSSNAEACPGCGHPIKKGDPKINTGCGCLILLLIVGGLVALGMYGKPLKKPLVSLNDSGSSSVSDPKSTSKVSPEFTNEQLKEHIKKYVAKLSEMGIDQSLISHVGYSEIDINTIEIHAKNAFALQPYRVRLQAAQNLWRVWASVHTPQKQDQSRIKILDVNGNEIGGSRVLGGSLIWVAEE